MRDLTDGQDQIEVPGRTVREIIENLDGIHPGMKARLCKDGQLSPRVSVIVDGQLSQLRLNQPVEDNGKVRFVPVMHGGC